MSSNEPRRALLLVAPDAAARLVESLGGRRIAGVPVVDLQDAIATAVARRFHVAIVGARADGSENELCRVLRGLGLSVVLLASVAGLVEVNARRKASGANLALASTYRIDDLIAAIDTLSAAPAPAPPTELAPVAPPEVAATDPAWIFGSTCARRPTGSLTIVTAELERAVFISGGAPIYAKSNAAGERLGALLVKKGRLAAPKLDAALAVAKKKGMKLGAVLEEMSILTPPEVLAEVRAQFTERTLAAFALPCTSTKFEEHKVLVQEPQIGLAPERLLLEGLRRSYDPRRIKALLPDATVLRLAGGAAALESFGFTLLEAAPLALVDGQRKVSAIVVGSKSPADALRGLYAAACAGLVRP